jgi:hypothetical protein
MSYTTEQIILIQQLRGKRHQLLSQDRHRPDLLLTVNRKLYDLTKNHIYNVDRKVVNQRNSDNDGMVV